MDQGHKFIAVILKSPTWCDLCGRPVLGVLRRFLVCRRKSVCVCVCVCLCGCVHAVSFMHAFMYAHVVFVNL